MSESLSAEEKRRLLRERRQAKMAKGNATSRLNTILSQGSSVKEAEAVSVLDESASKKTPEATEVVEEVKQTSPTVDEDPQISDLASLIGQSSSAPGEQEDIEQIFNKVFGQSMPSTGSGSDPTDMFSQMMNSALQQSASGEGSPFPNQDSEDVQYQMALNQYNRYQRKLWYIRFLAVRYITTITNFIYHYMTAGNSFKSSSYGYIRAAGQNMDVAGFFLIFVTCELVTLTSFHFISTKYSLYDNGGDNWILKGLSLLSAITPKLNGFRPIVQQITKYKVLFDMVVEDLSLLVVLFGLLSHI